MALSTLTRFLQLVVPVVSLVACGDGQGSAEGDVATSVVQEMADDPCVTYSGTGATLPLWVRKHVCVRVPPGTYELDAPIFLPAGHKLTGVPGHRDGTMLRASGRFPIWGEPVESTMIRTAGEGATSTVSHLFIYGADRAVRGVCCENVVVDDVRAWNMACDGIVLLENATVRRSDVAWNAIHSACPAVSTGGGSGIYLEVKPGTVGHGDIELEGNVIHENNGMGIDVNGVYFGRIAGNHVYGNTGPAGIGLYEASNWVIEHNTVRHWGGVSRYHPRCNAGPGGNRSAAFKICQDGGGRSAVNNTVRRNAFSGPYGILSVGNDELAPYEVPRASTFVDNDVFGSTYGCADDFRPGQWFEDDNRWTGNNCAGTPDTRPTYF